MDNKECSVRLDLSSVVTQIYNEFSWGNTSYAEGVLTEVLKEIFDSLQLSEYIKFEEDNGCTKISI